MAEVFNWPCELLRPLHTSFFIEWTSREAGANLYGLPQIISPNVGRWRVDVTIPREFEGARLKHLEAKISQMRGRFNIANLCICDPYKYGPAISPSQEPYSDGTWWSDGTGWISNPNTTEPMVVVNGAAEGGVYLRVGLTEPSRPHFRLGDMFSVNGFLYRVVGASATDNLIRFEPGAREPIPVDTVLQTDPPHFYGRFIDDMQGMRTREFLRWGQSITLSFVEAFERP